MPRLNSRCELLSKFVSLWFPITLAGEALSITKLWITFKIYIFVISNNPGLYRAYLWGVVNYFQNLYLCDFQQCALLRALSLLSCELLSKFVSLWLPTTERAEQLLEDMLWITFKICIFATPNNNWCSSLRVCAVVNYFQNLYLCDLQQRNQFYPQYVRVVNYFQNLYLFCTFVTSNNKEENILVTEEVVNYFQNLYLCDFQQQRLQEWVLANSCELLSKFVSLWSPTTFGFGLLFFILLWITFKICIFVI